MIALETTGQNSSGELELAGVEVGADRIVGDAESLDWLTSHAGGGPDGLSSSVCWNARWN